MCIRFEVIPSDVCLNKLVGLFIGYINIFDGCWRQNVMMSNCRRYKWPIQDLGSWLQTKMKIISLLYLSVASYVYRPIQYRIPAKYCIIKNCHNCARSFNFNFGTRASRAVCTAMYHQRGCCDFYIKRSKGYQFWIFWTIILILMYLCSGTGLDQDFFQVYKGVALKWLIKFEVGKNMWPTLWPSGTLKCLTPL